MTLSREQVGKIYTHAPAARLDAAFPHLLAATVTGEITTPIREAAFLAQLGHESAELRYMEEIADGSAYEMRADLGNLYTGDGRRFKGRGPIQLTGRANYARASKALGLDLITAPEAVASYDVGFRVAVWFWTSHRLNEAADLIPGSSIVSQRFDTITRAINGGLNGKAQRDGYFAAARKVLGC